MLIKELFSPKNVELISPEIRAFFRELCQSDWVREFGDVDYNEYQERMSDIEFELLNAPTE